MILFILPNLRIIYAQEFIADTGGPPFLVFSLSLKYLQESNFKSLLLLGFFLIIIKKSIDNMVICLS